MRACVRACVRVCVCVCVCVKSTQTGSVNLRSGVGVGRQTPQLGSVRDGLSSVGPSACMLIRYSLSMPSGPDLYKCVCASVAGLFDDSAAILSFVLL